MAFSATVNTYARLEKPKQFRLSDSFDITVYYSSDFIKQYNGGKYMRATLVILGGKYPTNVCYKATLSCGVAAENRYKVFSVPENALKNGLKLNSDGTVITWHSQEPLKARVDFGLSTDSNGHVVNPVFSSNEIQLPLLLNTLETPLYWGHKDENGTTVAIDSTSSEHTMYLCYQEQGDLWSNGDSNINSYRYFLYDKYLNLLYDSGTLYDNIYNTTPSKTTTVSGGGERNTIIIPCKFTNLADGEYYFIEAQVTLVGGYEFNTPLKNSFSVSYSDYALTPNRLILTNLPTQGCVKVTADTYDVQHTKYIVSRSVKNVDKFITIETRNSEHNPLFYDYTVLPNTTYIYKISLYNNETHVGDFYNEVMHTLKGMCIADSETGYCTNIGVQKGAIQKNQRVLHQSTIGDKYSYAVVTTEANYHSCGSTSGVFYRINRNLNTDTTGHLQSVEECYHSYQNINKGNVEFSHELLNWLNNGKAKLLKFEDGFSAIIGIEGEPSMNEQDNRKVFNCTFGWKEIADCTDADNFLKLGLVGGEII